jgi:hypothetical protein
MSLNWYTISISLQSSNTKVFEGKFSVNSSSESIIHFYNINNLNNNLLEYTSDDYSADYKFTNNNFTFNGTAIKNIPDLDVLYNSCEWSLWYYPGDLYPNLSYKDKNNGQWFDVLPYGGMFSFDIKQIVDLTKVPLIPAPVYVKYDIVLTNGSNNILNAFILVDITTNVISVFQDNADGSNLLINNNDNYSDNKYINGNFTLNGTLISNIPSLSAVYPAATKWQLFLYVDPNTQVSKTALAYKNSSNNWIYLMPYATNYVVSSTLYNPNNVPCFNHDTKILCLNKKFEEEYLPVQSLKKGDLVKTFLHGYRKIKSIGINRFVNDPSNFRKCMYIMSKSKNASLIEDLIITGDHSILVDVVSREERILTRKRLMMSEEQIDSKKLVMSSISSQFQQIMNNNEYTYYHFCVEDEDSSNRKFGVWSNGILSEIPSANQFKHLKIGELVML